jgi:holo-[acyl-carrier protein] synthase
VIAGLGIEWIELPRFASLLERHERRLRTWVFTERELAYADRRGRRAVESLAVRFAAKVAARRALALPGFHWRQIEVVREGEKAPTLELAGEARRAAERLGVVRVHLTLTHDAACCVAQVLLEDDRSGRANPSGWSAEDGRE